MKNSTSFASEAPPPSVIKVSIFNAQYSIRPTENLTEDDILELADYVDDMMRQVSQRSTHDDVRVAITVALNIAAQMREEQKRCAATIRQLIQRMDETIDGDLVHDTLRAAPTADPRFSPGHQ